MFKTISAALIAVSVLAAPAMAGGFNHQHGRAHAHPHAFDARAQMHGHHMHRHHFDRHHHVRPHGHRHLNLYKKFGPHKTFGHVTHSAKTVHAHG